MYPKILETEYFIVNCLKMKLAQVEIESKKQISFVTSRQRIAHALLQPCETWFHDKCNN